MEKITINGVADIGAIIPVQLTKTAPEHNWMSPGLQLAIIGETLYQALLQSIQRPARRAIHFMFSYAHHDATQNGRVHTERHLSPATQFVLQTAFNLRLLIYLQCDCTSDHCSLPLHLFAFQDRNLSI